MGKKIKYTAMAISIMALLSLGIYHFGGQNRRESDAKSGPRTQWRTCKVRSGSISNRVSLAGKITPLITTEVVSVVAARIHRILVNNGDQVRRGQVLIELNAKDLITNVEKARIKYLKTKAKLKELESWENSPAYLTAKFQIENTKTDYEEARRTYEENVKLYEQKAISQNDLHQSQIALVRAKIALEAAKVQFADKKKKASEMALAEARAAFNVAKSELETQQDALKYKNVTAPSDGVVAFSDPTASSSEKKLALIKNRMVNPGETLLKIESHSRLAVEARLNEFDVYRVSKNQACNILVQALPYERFTGRITQIYPVTSRRDGRTFFAIRCQIDQEKTSLKPGLTAEIQIILEKKSNALIVPISAVALLSGQNGVFILEEGKPVFRAVEVGIKTARKVEVLSGVEKGQKIICRIPSALLKRQKRQQGPV